MKSTVCPIVTALARVNVMEVPEIDMPVTALFVPATSTAKEVASTPAPSIVSSKLRVNSVGDDVLTLPPVKPGACVSSVVTVKICAARAVPVGLTTMTRPRVAPVGTATVIVVDVAVKVVVDLLPN